MTGGGPESSAHNIQSTVLIQGHPTRVCSSSPWQQQGIRKQCTCHLRQRVCLQHRVTVSYSRHAKLVTGLHNLWPLTISGKCYTGHCPADRLQEVIVVRHLLHKLPEGLHHTGLHHQRTELTWQVKEKEGGEKIDLTWSACWMPTSVHAAHQFIVYHTSIMPSYSLHIHTLHRLRPPPLPHSQSL